MLKYFTVSKFSSESTARLWALESSVFISLRNWVRHSVTVTVNTMYSTSAVPVMTANQMSYFTASRVSTSTTSIRVGMML